MGQIFGIADIRKGEYKVRRIPVEIDTNSNINLFDFRVAYPLGIRLHARFRDLSFNNWVNAVLSNSKVWITEELETYGERKPTISREYPIDSLHLTLFGEAKGSYINPTNIYFGMQNINIIGYEYLQSVQLKLKYKSTRGLGMPRMIRLVK